MDSLASSIVRLSNRGMSPQVVSWLPTGPDGEYNGQQSHAWPMVRCGHPWTQIVPAFSIRCTFTSTNSAYRDRHLATRPGGSHYPLRAPRNAKHIRSRANARENSTVKLLGMFAKYWEPGQVKTRLAATLGEQPSARVYQVFVETLIHRLADVADHRILAFAPPDREHNFRRVQETWDLQRQLDPGDLGDRMQDFFETALRDGFDRVVLIGSDSPDLPVDVLHQAFEQLGDHDVVLGPSLDGGYYLIGAAGQVPSVFDGMPWSSPELWETTVRRLTEQQCRFAVLPTWYDVDTLADLTLLNKKLARHTEDPWLENLRALVNTLLHDNA